MIPKHQVLGSGPGCKFSSGGGKKECGLSSVQSLIGLRQKAERPWASHPWSVTMGLPRMGTQPGASNEPPGKRQETISGQTQRVSLFSHQGIPPWDSSHRTCLQLGGKGAEAGLESAVEAQKVKHCGSRVAQSSVGAHPVLKWLGMAGTAEFGEL